MSHKKPYVWCGLKFQPPGYSFEAVDYDQVQMICVTHGQLHFETNGQPPMALGPGQAVMLSRGSAFRTFCTDSSYEGCFVIVRDEDDPAYHFTPRVIQVTPPMVYLSGLILQEAAQADFGSQRILSDLGCALLWHGLRLVHSAPAASADAEDYGRYWAQRARQVLQSTLYTARPASQALASLRLSYRQLSRHFVAAFGLTPKEYQLRLRIDQAKRLLTETSMPVTSIAFEVGFASSQHFATRFAAQTGQTPSAWRRQTMMPPTTAPKRHAADD